MNLEKITAQVNEMAASNAGSLGATVKFKFPEGAVYLDDTVSPPTISNDDKDAQCTVLIDMPDFAKLLDGDMDPMSAFMGGVMKIEGDMSIAMKLTSIF
jgi:putative sterol carrier protein